MQQRLPQTCLLCSAPAGNAPFCPACVADLPWHRAAQCPRCALPTHEGALCGQCLKHPPSFDHTAAAFAYGFPVDGLIQAFKYGHRLAVGAALAGLQAGYAAEHPRPDLLLAMPLHPERLKERGFNQALELAKALAKSLSLPLEPQGARRVRHRPPQVGLPWKERAANIRGAFESDLELAGKHVAMVDDVMTTGASLHELGLALRRRGAAEISAWVVARALAD